MLLTFLGPAPTTFVGGVTVNVGETIDVDPDQTAALLAAGWSTPKPPKPPAPTATTDGE